MPWRRRRTLFLRVFSATFALTMIASIPACKDNSSFEEAGENIDEGIEEVRDEIDDATNG